MELINGWIRALSEAGALNSAYSTINTVAEIIAVLFGVIHGRKLRVGYLPVVAAVAVQRLTAGPLMNGILYVENGFATGYTYNAPVVFVFVPLLGYLVAKILKKPWQDIWDVMMPVPLIMFIGARIACTVAGCCYGYPCSWGVYNAGLEEYQFPIQLLEAFATVLIVAAAVFREKKNQFVPDGRNVPIMLISYGIIRFFLEFLHNNKKILLGCSSTSFHCILMILVGSLTLFIIRKHEKKKIASSPER